MIPWPTVAGFWIVLSLMLAGVWIWGAYMARRNQARRFERHTAQALAVTRHPSTPRPRMHVPPDDDPAALARMDAQIAEWLRRGIGDQ